MGCDIHLHIEVKLNGKWEHWAAPGVDRNYRLFSRMAGVRQYQGDRITAISAPKGMPKDPATVTAFECARWGDDGHNHSWLNMKEIVILAEFVKKRLSEKGKWASLSFYTLHSTYICGLDFSGLIKYKSELPKEITDVRFVFWFDN